MVLKRLSAALSAVALLGLAALALPPARAQAQSTEQAMLAVEEAELRERLMTALAVAESVRLRGRTILVAMSEIGRVRRRVDKIDPTSERRAEFEARLKKLELRRIELDGEVDTEFQSYIVLIAEISEELWSRIDRVGDGLARDLAERRLSRLAQLYPVVKRHIEEFNKARSVTQAVTERWRREVDDTYEMRQERLRAAPPPEPSLADPDEKEEDI
ncbi:hypothetical protein LNKW23_45580 [Paralimibaculum aggregatum]|uniref:DUF4142 domain-containing protein n=1 Tax=Paralimibaculum aggregatum TaxID=3036245 RepID=A0ABQ6LTD7_9RHOB|nr:hypothetical protein [Limibaculum sp. NKW23]GMG85338.1 hypothetical protein LNKW23_45580 [Limibaculum sp. NKW23]